MGFYLRLTVLALCVAAIAAAQLPAEILEDAPRHESAPAQQRQEPAHHQQEPAQHQQEPAQHQQEPAQHQQEPAQHQQEPAQHQQEPPKPKPAKKPDEPKPVQPKSKEACEQVGQRKPVVENCKQYSECSKDKVWKTHSCYWFQKFDSQTLKCMYWGAKCATA